MEQGRLWKLIRKTTEHAIRTGALKQFPTSTVAVEEDGVTYFVRVLEALRKKDEARREQKAPAVDGKKFDPFLPPEEDLTVAELGTHHLAVLNKFNVLENHLLIVTRQFEDQQMLLTFRDLEMLRVCMADYDSLGFYNGGAEAGASQEHKHLQVVPLPLFNEGPAVPISPLFEGAVDRVPAFPFKHSFRRFPPGIGASPAKAAVETWKLYSAMLKELGMTPPTPGKLTRQTQPYCLLVTREWILLVPRSKEFYGDVSLNSLAFAGSFFVRDREQLEVLKARGMMNALREVSVIE